MLSPPQLVDWSMTTVLGGESMAPVPPKKISNIEQGMSNDERDRFLYPSKFDIPCSIFEIAVLIGTFTYYCQLTTHGLMPTITPPSTR
jgi:hypothetical protein